MQGGALREHDYPDDGAVRQVTVLLKPGHYEILYSRRHAAPEATLMSGAAAGSGCDSGTGEGSKSGGSDAQVGRAAQKRHVERRAKRALTCVEHRPQGVAYELWHTN